MFWGVRAQQERHFECWGWYLCRAVLDAEKTRLLWGALGQPQGRGSTQVVAVSLQTGCWDALCSSYGLGLCWSMQGQRRSNDNRAADVSRGL